MWKIVFTRIAVEISFEIWEPSVNNFNGSKTLRKLFKAVAEDQRQKLQGFIKLTKTVFAFLRAERLS